MNSPDLHNKDKKNRGVALIFFAIMLLLFGRTRAIKVFYKTDSIENSISKKELKKSEKKCNSIISALKNQEDIDNAINQLVSFIESNDTVEFNQKNLDILEVARLFNSGDISIIKQSSAFSDGKTIFRIEKLNAKPNSFFKKEDEKPYSELDTEYFTITINSLLQDENGVIPDELRDRLFEVDLKENNSNQILKDIIWIMLYYCINNLGMKQDEIVHNVSYTKDNNSPTAIFRKSNALQGVKFKPGDVNIRSYPNSFQKGNVYCKEENEVSRSPKKDTKGDLYKDRFTKENGDNPNRYTLQGRY